MPMYFLVLFENEYLETGIVLSTVAFHYYYPGGIAKID